MWTDHPEDDRKRPKARHNEHAKEHAKQHAKQHSTEHVKEPSTEPSKEPDSPPEESPIGHVDVNLSILRGRLVAEPDLRVFDSGVRMVRYLAAVRSDGPPRRLDVIPIALWHPSEEVLRRPGQTGDRIAMVGSIQRRFWPAPPGRRSRLEIAATELEILSVGK